MSELDERATKAGCRYPDCNCGDVCKAEKAVREQMQQEREREYSK